MALRYGGVWGPAGSKKLETGVWRTETPVVDHDKCKKCNICERYCPEGCIDIKENGCNINLFYCKGCGICVHECPFKAIKMEV